MEKTKILSIFRLIDVDLIIKQENIYMDHLSSYNKVILQYKIYIRTTYLTSFTLLIFNDILVANERNWKNDPKTRSRCLFVRGNFKNFR